MIMWFFFFEFVYVMDYIDGFPCIEPSRHPWKPTWSCWMCSWIWFVRILLSIFALIFISKIGLKFSFSFGSLCDLRMRVTMGSQNELGTLPSVSNLWNSLKGICITDRSINITELKTEIYQHTHEHLIFDKETKTSSRIKESIFNKWCWSNWQSACRRMQIVPYLSPYSKLNSKWIKAFHIKLDTLKKNWEIASKSLALEKISWTEH